MYRVRLVRIAAFLYENMKKKSFLDRGWYQYLTRHTDTFSPE
jgi:hypothetical protein